MSIIKVDQADITRDVDSPNIALKTNLLANYIEILESQKNGLVLNWIELGSIIGMIDVNAIKIVPILKDNKLELVILAGMVNNTNDDLEIIGGGNDTGQKLVKKG